MMPRMRTGAAFCAAIFAPFITTAAIAADNQLTAAEKAEGRRLLFDGSSYANWIDPSKKSPPGDSFAIEDGCLRAVAHPKITEDLFTRDTFGDFELVFTGRSHRPETAASSTAFRITYT
jgi:hypothetical protein